MSNMNLIQVGIFTMVGILTLAIINLSLGTVIDVFVYNMAQHTQEMGAPFGSMIDWPIMWIKWFFNIIVVIMVVLFMYMIKAVVVKLWYTREDEYDYGYGGY